MRRVGSVLIAIALSMCTLHNAAVAQQISFPPSESRGPVSLTADSVSRWHSGIYDVLHLKGNVEIEQDELLAKSSQAIVWVEVPDDGVDIESIDTSFRIILYLEGDAEITRDGDSFNRIRDQSLLERRLTRHHVNLKTSETEGMADQNSEVYQRAYDRLQASLNATRVGWPDADSSSNAQAQFQDQPLLVSPQTGQVIPAPSTQPAATYDMSQFGDRPVTETSSQAPFSAPFQSPGTSTGEPGGISYPSLVPSPFADAARGPGGNDSINFAPRDSKMDLNIERVQSGPNEETFIVTGGARAVITSSEINQLEPFSGDQNTKITILADNIIRWVTTLADGSKIDELYMDGNVVFAKEGRTIEANQMYYNINSRQGTILNAQLMTKVPGYKGKVKLKADVIQQLDENNLQAIGAAFTTSRIGFPRYWLQSQAISLTRQPTQLVDEETGLLDFDETTGQPKVGSDYFVQAESNRLYANGIPVLFWPKYRSNLSDRTSYLRRFRIGNDQIFGFQFGTGWDLYKVLGRKKPRGTDWVGILDYLGERGIGFGTEFKYSRNGIFGYPGRVTGAYKSWFINDDGLDLLGRQRFNLAPEEDFRGRSIGRHRHDFAPGSTLRGEFGYISDRNFLEQFFEREWDTDKDATTGIWLERNFGVNSLNLTADVRINDFFTQTNWLPRLDQFMIGQPLFGDRVVWHNHSSIGYGKIEVADAPTNAQELLFFDPLAWEAESEGVRFHTRHELDFPIQLGPTKLVPYVLGDLGYWKEDINGDDLLRGVGQIGIRASVPIWKVNPNIQSTLWNVNGLAHKVSFDFDAFYADSSQDMDRLPLYDQLDDDAQEHFRRRFAFNTFGILPGGDTPLQYDERYFALRSGLQGNVTSPSAEIADDLAVVKVGVRQRWQTRRGTPGQQRVVDWITLDAKTSFFPDADRDNFGAGAGLFDYDFRWHLGDRVSILSDGFADFFSQGLRTVSVGAFAERPEIGNAYIGFRSIEGPISSNIVTASAVYRMSDTWGIKGRNANRLW